MVKGIYFIYTASQRVKGYLVYCPRCIEFTIYNCRCFYPTVMGFFCFYMKEAKKKNNKRVEECNSPLVFGVIHSYFDHFQIPTNKTNPHVFPEQYFPITNMTKFNLIKYSSSLFLNSIYLFYIKRSMTEYVYI